MWFETGHKQRKWERIFTIKNKMIDCVCSKHKFFSLNIEKKKEKWVKMKEKKNIWPCKNWLIRRCVLYHVIWRRRLLFWKELSNPFLCRCFSYARKQHQILMTPSKVTHWRNKSSIKSFKRNRCGILTYIHILYIHLNIFRGKRTFNHILYACITPFFHKISHLQVNFFFI